MKDIKEMLAMIDKESNETRVYPMSLKPQLKEYVIDVLERKARKNKQTKFIVEAIEEKIARDYK